MKILFCSPCPLVKELGMSKVLMELAESLSPLGWDCSLVAPEDVMRHAADSSATYAEALRDFLQSEAARFDVVDYDHTRLPYARSLFPKETLFTARVALLPHHFAKIHPPRLPDWKQHLHELRTGAWFRGKPDDSLERANLTTRNADLVNVLNREDRRELIASGIDSERIALIPNGMTEQRLKMFEAAGVGGPSAEPVVAFVGTFDNRKGGHDLPYVFEAIAREIPQVRFRLLGTAGLYQSAEKVKSFFPRHLRERLDVTPKFPADELPALLTGVAAGVFPSYIEGFGLGVLEMLAASVPVVAYRAPGPPEMLTEDFLVERGNTSAMAARVVALLRNGDALRQARQWAGTRAREFSWNRVAVETDAAYRSHLERSQGRTSKSKTENPIYVESPARTS